MGIDSSFRLSGSKSETPQASVLRNGPRQLAAEQAISPNARAMCVKLRYIRPITYYCGQPQENPDSRKTTEGPN